MKIPDPHNQFPLFSEYLAEDPKQEGCRSSDQELSVLIHGVGSDVYQLDRCSLLEDQFLAAWSACRLQYCASTLMNSRPAGSIHEMKEEGVFQLPAKFRVRIRVHFLRVRVSPTTNLQISRSLIEAGSCGN